MGEWTTQVTQVTRTTRVHPHLMRRLLVVLVSFLVSPPVSSALRI
jgi:hypothetical protein